MKIGAQTFTIRESMKTPEDIRVSLLKLADIGYQYAQLSCWGEIEPVLLREYADAAGVALVLTHTPPERSPAAAEAEALSAPQLPKLPARERVDDAYFDGAVFFGNSLVAGLSQYGGLDRADFLASVGVNVADARIALLPGAAEGSGITMFQVLVGRPREKLYTLFGINEMGFEPDYFATLYESLIDAALAVQPELTVYITSLSPLTEERCGWDTVYTMEKITAYNEALYALAARRGWYYLDLMDALAGPDGYLPAEISTDGVHLTPEGYLIWADYLRTHYAD